MIASLSEVKSIINITNTESDEFIKVNMKFVEEEICRYCNNKFIDKGQNYIVANNIVFNSVDNSINRDNVSEFLDVSDSFRVLNSRRNDGVHVVQSKTDNKIVVDQLTVILDEASTETIMVARVQYPLHLKVIFANMIKFNIERLKILQGVKSEKLDDYSVTYEDNLNNYPKSLMTSLNAYRNLYNVSGW